MQFGSLLKSMSAHSATSGMRIMLTTWQHQWCPPEDSHRPKNTTLQVGSTQTTITSCMILKTRRNISKLVETWVHTVGITGWALCNRKKDEQFHAVQPRVYNKQTKRPLGGSFRVLDKKKTPKLFKSLNSVFRCQKAAVVNICQYLTIGRLISS